MYEAREDEGGQDSLTYTLLLENIGDEKCAFCGAHAPAENNLPAEMKPRQPTEVKAHPAESDEVRLWLWVCEARQLVKRPPCLIL